MKKYIAISLLALMVSSAAFARAPRFRRDVSPADIRPTTKRVIGEPIVYFVESTPAYNRAEDMDMEKSGNAAVNMNPIYGDVWVAAIFEGGHAGIPNKAKVAIKGGELELQTTPPRGYLNKLRATFKIKAIRDLMVKSERAKLQALVEIFRKRPGGDHRVSYTLYNIRGVARTAEGETYTLETPNNLRAATYYAKITIFAEAPEFYNAAAAINVRVNKIKLEREVELY